LCSCWEEGKEEQNIRALILRTVSGFIWVNSDLGLVSSFYFRNAGNFKHPEKSLSALYPKEQGRIFIHFLV